MTILENLQSGVSDALQKRWRLDADIRSGGYLLIEAIAGRIGQNELGRRIGQSPSNMSSMRHGRRPIPESVLIAMCEMKLDTGEPIAKEEA